MRMLLVAVAMIGMCMPMAGCSKSKPDQPPVVKKLTPEQIKKICNDAGQAAALTWVAAAKPGPEDIQAVKFVLDQITAAMAGYQGEGFIGMLPQIDEAIKKAFPGTDERSVALRKLSHLLAMDSLTALDNLFYAHPDWTKKGDQAAQYVAAFATGASSALDLQAVQMREKAIKK